MKKLFLLILTLFLGIGVVIINTPKAQAATDGQLAILIEVNEDTSILFDWQLSGSARFITEANEIIETTGNLYKTLIYDDNAPSWVLADANDQENITAYLVDIFAYFETRGTNAGEVSGYAEGYAAGYTNGYALGEDAGYIDGYKAGVKVDSNGSYDVGYAKGYTSGFANGALSSGEEAYNAGFTAGINQEANNFYDDIGNWLVPAIIVVLFGSAVITFINIKRRNEE